MDGKKKDTESAKHSYSRGKRNKCEICPKEYSHRQHMIRHMWKAHGTVYMKKRRVQATAENPRPHKCELCEKAFVRHKHLLRHRISKHIGWPCPECNKQFVKLKEHLQNMHGKKLQLPFECYVCKRAYKSKRCVRSHIQTMHCKLSQSINCPLCLEPFDCRIAYQRHRNRHKYARGKFTRRICEKCGKSVLNSHFKNHELTHAEAQLQCSYCEKRFRSNPSLKLHERTHTNERPYECEVCHSRFIDGSTLRIHRRNHTGESPFVCHFCGRRTKQAQNLASHYRHFHRNLEVTSKIIRFNARVFARYENDELELRLREDGDLCSLLAAGTIEYNKELEQQDRAKEMENQIKFEALQKEQVNAKFNTRKVPPSTVIETPQIEQICVDEEKQHETKTPQKQDPFIVKRANDEIEFAEVKVEFDDASAYNGTDFVDTFEIKIEEPWELVDAIDQSDLVFSGQNDFTEAPANNAIEAPVNLIKMEKDSGSATDESGIEPISIAELENLELKVSSDEPTLAQLCFCHICIRKFANAWTCATHMMQAHNIKAPDAARPHKCLLCDKSYGQSSHLWRHYGKQHGSAPDRRTKNMMRILQKQNIAIEIVQQNGNVAEPTNSVDVKPELASDPATMQLLSYCQICDRKYANQGACATHMLEVHKITLPEIVRPHKCILCDRSYVKSNHLSRHYKKVHGGARKILKVKLKTNQMRNSSIEIVQQHDETDTNPVDDAENANLDTSGIDTEPASAQPSNYCQICEKRFKFNSHLKTHMWGVHKIQMPVKSRGYKCTLCNKSYLKPMSLSNHYRKKHDGIPDGLRIRKTTTEKKTKKGATAEPFQLPIDENGKFKLPEGNTPIEQYRYCQLCDKRYVNQWGFATHMWQVHKLKLPEPARPFACGICGKCYMKRAHLARHHKCEHERERMPTDLKGFECYVCHKSFTVLTLLKRHTFKEHIPVERSQICPTCGVTTARLSRHITLVHAIKEAQCQVCARVFKHPSRLSNHMKTHTLPVKCDLCPKRFVSSSAMRQHRRYHTNEKLFACKFCGTRYIEKSTCLQHERIHTGEKPYKCHLCDARTIQAGNLKSHYRHFHKMIVKHVSMTKLVTDAEMIPLFQ